MTDSSMLAPEFGWGLVTCLGVLWILLGWLWGRKAKTEEGFTLAGRKVGLALGGATTMATWVTSNTTMLAPVFAYKFGLWGMLAYSTASLASFCLPFFFPVSESFFPRE